MKLLAIFVISVNLTGCAGILQVVGNYYDNKDLCQTWNKPQGYQAPNYCGAGNRATLVTRDYNTNRILTTTTLQK